MDRPTRWEIAFRLLAVALCAGVLLATFLRGADLTDLRILLVAARHLSAGETVYDLRDANEHTKPPLATLLFVPLSHLDETALNRAWDALNVGLYLALAAFLLKRYRASRRGGIATPLLLVVLVTLNPWNQEIRLGQYNTLTLALLVLAGLGPFPFLQGLPVAIALLMKPTNLVFLPWAVHQSRRPMRLIAGTGFSLAALAAVYTHFFGWERLYADHRAWLALLPVSGARHLHRTDNLGLVRLVDELGLGRWVWSLWVAGWGAILFAERSGADWLGRLSIAGIVCLLLSPMAWFQNYVLLLPFVVYLLVRAGDGGADRWPRVLWGSALGVLYFGLEVNRALCVQGWLSGPFCETPVPVWAVLAAAALAVAAAGVPRGTRRAVIPVESPG